MLFSMKRTMAILALGTFAAAGLTAQQKTPEFKDRAEYDLFEQVRKEQNGNTQLQLLDQWKQKYPDSQWDEVRMGMMIQAYQKAGNGKGMYQAAKDTVAKYPKNLAGLYNLCVLTPFLNDTSAEALDTGEKAGKAFLGILDEVYDPAKKAANVSEEEWKRDRSNNEAIARKALGWVAMQRQKWDEAENQFVEVLKRTPGDAQASSWTGTVILRQKKVEKQALGLYHFCRAAVWEGPGALAPEQRKQFHAYVEKTYVNFHGGKDGLDDILNTAKTNVFPPDGFKIESADELAAKAEEELKKTNPQLALWISLKRGLAGADGQSFFETQLKDRAIPGGVEVGGTKVDKLKGTVVSKKEGLIKGTKREMKGSTKEIVVGITKAEMSEVTLRFEEPQMLKVEPGMEIQFNGVPVEFTADPFNVVFDVELDHISGIEKLAPAAAKKAPAAAAPAAPVKKAPPAAPPKK